MEVKTIPVIPKPAIPAEPVAPALSNPPIIVLTAEDARYYADVCQRYEDPAEDAQDVLSSTGLSRAAACRWAIYGFTVQGEISEEDNLNRMAAYAEAMRAYAEQLRGMIWNLWNAVEATREDAGS